MDKFLEFKNFEQVNDLITFDLYTVKSIIHPLSIFNDGKKTYIQMSNEISTTDLPTVYTLSDDDKLLTTVTRYRKPYFVVDGVKPNYALIVGSSTSDNQLRVDILATGGVVVTLVGGLVGYTIFTGNIPQQQQDSQARLIKQPSNISVVVNNKLVPN